MDKKISICVLMSMYNCKEKELKLAIESMLNQTYKDFKILIIDDGTKGNEVNIVKSYNDPRIILIQNETNIGLENSLNKGIELIDADYIVRMDTDDIAYNDRIEKQVDFISKHPEYSVVSGKVEFFDENGIFGISKITGEIKKDDLLFGTPFVHPAMIIKTKDIKEAGGYPLYKRCEDYAMIMNMYANGYKGYIMNDIILKYRMDRNAYIKKKNRDRLTEAKAKAVFFKKMKIKWYKKIYILKPLLLCIMPKRILSSYHKKKFKK